MVRPPCELRVAGEHVARGRAFGVAVGDGLLALTMNAERFFINRCRAKHSGAVVLLGWRWNRACG